MINLSFSERVRNVVKQIPRGSTCSYTVVAERAGSPRGARAVARIMATNYDPEVPCHRVIRADGSIGGYNRGGEKRKSEILELELSQ